MGLCQTGNSVVKFCTVAIVVFGAAELCAAGILQSAEAAAARRAAGQAKSAAVVAAERAAWQKIAREADASAVQNIQRRFGDYLPRSGQVLPPARVLTREEFDLHLQRHFPDMTAERRKAILGYHKGGAVVVNMNDQQFILTLAHERLHQLAHPRFRETFGHGLNEGVTERLAKMTARDLHLIDLPPVYTLEQSLAETLGARAGFDRVQRAYSRARSASFEISSMPTLAPARSSASSRQATAAT